MTQDKRLKVTPWQRSVIHHRFYNRVRTGETVQEIADSFGISVYWTRMIARSVEKGKAPVPDRTGGSDDTAAHQAYPKGRAA
jgi:hypothetical protein